MRLITNKSFDEVSAQMHIELEKLGFSIDDGSVVRMFADLMAKYISDFDGILTQEHLNCFVSTASGGYLDNIGQLLDCQRLEDESDNSYRARIVNKTNSSAKANETALKLALLSEEIVEDVIIRRFSHGPGSFTIIPIVDERTEENLQLVEEIVNEVKSYGEKTIVKYSDLKYVKLNIKLMFSNEISDNEIQKQSIANSVRSAVADYINSLKIGESLIVNELTQRVMEVSDYILDYSPITYNINGEDCLLINQGAKWDEQFILSTDVDSLIVN